MNNTIRPKKIIYVISSLIFLGLIAPLYIIFFTDVEDSAMFKFFSSIVFIGMLYFLKRLLFDYKIEIKDNKICIKTISLAGRSGNAWTYDRQNGRYDLNDIISVRLEYSKHFPNTFSFEKAVGKGDLLLIVTNKNNDILKFRVGIFNRHKISDLFTKNSPNLFTDLTR